MFASRRRQAGFTLLEMLVAMGMMSVLAGALYASLLISFRARDSALRALEPVRKAELTMQMLRADLECVLPPSGILAAEFIGQDQVDEEGRDADSVSFHAVAMGMGLAGSGPDIVKVELALASLDDGSGTALVRRVQTNLLAPEVTEPAAEVLCRRVQAFDVKYYDGSSWQDSWDSTLQDNLLPLAVQVTLELAGPKGREDAQAYRVGRVMLIPCARLPEESETSTASSGTP
jgi:type II secretion system protein J